MKKVLIAGANGLASEVVSWSASIFQVVGYTTPKKSKENEFSLPGMVYSDEEVTPEIAGTDQILFGMASPKVKKILHDFYKNKGFKFPKLIHSSSTISSSVKLSEGVIIGPNCVISPNVSIGAMSYINFQCGIGHDSIISDYVQVNPGSQLGGTCRVGEESIIGSGSTLVQGVTLGSKVTVASGSVVFGKVDDNLTIIGNPAKRIKIK